MRDQAIEPRRAHRIELLGTVAHIFWTRPAILIELTRGLDGWPVDLLTYLLRSACSAPCWILPQGFGGHLGGPAERSHDVRAGGAEARCAGTITHLRRLPPFGFFATLAQSSSRPAVTSRMTFRISS